MTLTKEEREANVEYRLERAYETLIEAKDLIKLDHWFGAANRLYYACYYAVTALLIDYGYIAYTHRGTKGLMGKYFVSTNIISRDHNKLFEKLFDLRQNSDYGAWIIIDKSDIEPLLEPAEQFIATIEELIKGKACKKI
jgi:uncharacterized protein (UPF0332 family)